MRHIDRWSSVILAAASAVVLAGPAGAETQADQPTIEALMKKIDALQSRLDKVEGRERAAKSSADKPTAHATHQAPPPAATAIPASTPIQPYPAAAIQQAAAPIPNLLPPEPMGNQYEGEGGDALRSDLPGLSLRIPGFSIGSAVLRLCKPQWVPRFQRPQPDRCADRANNPPRPESCRHARRRFRIVRAI